MVYKGITNEDADNMSSYTFGFHDINKSNLQEVGGKGANLGELARIDGITVPNGFCISTAVYKKVTGDTPSISGLYDELSQLRQQDRKKISVLSSKIRRVIERSSIPAEVEKEIIHRLSQIGEKNAFAVRSSATAEDLPTASFAGQQDTYLNVIGRETILSHIIRCWASLFTERATTYRLQNGIDHRKVYLAVVVQKMIFPEVAGILFTADPLTANRKIASIDAGFGLGEALVSGLVNADNYRVHDGMIIDKKVARKKRAVYASEGGGTIELEVAPDQQNHQALTDEQILRLEAVGRKIEEHFGQPQDIEWCLAENTFYIVQSRSITTLYPVPEFNDRENHVFISVGHQ